MTNNFYGGYNPYQQQLQQLQQRLQAAQTATPIVPQTPVMQPQVAPPQMPLQEDKILVVVNEEAAKSTNIPLDGSTTYFKYEDSILARRWNISEGRVCSVTYKLQQEEPQPPVQEVIIDKEDRLKGIEDTLQEILKKVTYPINKKAGKIEKTEEGVEKDAK